MVYLLRTVFYIHQVFSGAISSATTNAPFQALPLVSLLVITLRSHYLLVSVIHLLLLQLVPDPEDSNRPSWFYLLLRSFSSTKFAHHTTRWLTSKPFESTLLHVRPLLSAAVYRPPSQQAESRLLRSFLNLPDDSTSDGSTFAPDGPSPTDTETTLDTTLDTNSLQSAPWSIHPVPSASSTSSPSSASHSSSDSHIPLPDTITYRSIYTNSPTSRASPSTTSLGSLVNSTMDQSSSDSTKENVSPVLQPITVRPSSLSSLPSSMVSSPRYTQSIHSSYPSSSSTSSYYSGRSRTSSSTEYIAPVEFPTGVPWP